MKKPKMSLILGLSAALLSLAATIHAGEMGSETCQTQGPVEVCMNPEGSARLLYTGYLLNGNYASANQITAHISIDGEGYFSSVLQPALNSLNPVPFTGFSGRTGNVTLDVYL